MKCNLSAIFAFFLFFPPRVRNFNLVTVLAFMPFEIQPFSDTIIFFGVTIIIIICFFFSPWLHDFTLVAILANAFVFHLGCVMLRTFAPKMFPRSDFFF